MLFVPQVCPKFGNGPCSKLGHCLVSLLLKSLFLVLIFGPH